MTASSRSSKVELSRKKRRVLARILRRTRKWGAGVCVKETVGFGQIRFRVKACLRWDGERIALACMGLTTRSKDGFHKKVLSGPVGQLLEASAGDPVRSGVFFPKLTRLRAKGERQIANAHRRLAKLAAKLKTTPERLLALATEAAAGKKRVTSAGRAGAASRPAGAA